MSELSEQFKSSYRKTTEDCLIELHGLSRTDAIAAVKGYRSRLADAAQELGAEWMEDLEYHEEPFNLACDLAGKDPHWEVEGSDAVYGQIMARNEQRAGLPIYAYPETTTPAIPLTELPQPTR